jgi:hypothetical protein
MVTVLNHYTGPKHSALQSALNEHLVNLTRTIGKGKNKRKISLCPGRGKGTTAGATIRQYFTPQERLNALDNFYRNYANGQYYGPYLRELQEVNNRGGLR